MSDDQTIAQRYARLLQELGVGLDEHSEALIAARRVTYRDRFVERDAKRFVASLPDNYDEMRAVAMKFWRQIRHAEDEATRARDKAHRYSSAMGEVVAENKNLRLLYAHACDSCRREGERADRSEARVDELLARLNTRTTGDVEGA